MVPSISSSKGLTADLRVFRGEKSSGHKSRVAIAISILCLAFLLASILHPISERVGETSTDSIAPSPANNSYMFKVFGLNHTSTRAVDNGTTLFFDTAQLPVNFSGVQFGDYRMDSQYSATYYAGSGVLLNSSGTNAWIALAEGNGKIVSRVFYRGQAIVALNGQTTTYINSSRPAAYNGTDLMVQDWRNGNWSPNDGIIIEHPKNVTISGARFYLAVYQPGVSAQLPEFQSVLVPIVGFAMIAVVVIGKNRKCGKEELGIQSMDPRSILAHFWFWNNSGVEDAREREYRCSIATCSQRSIICQSSSRSRCWSRESSST